MRNSRVRTTSKSGARSWSRREVLARGAGVASVLALPQLWVPKAWGQTATFDYYISTSGNDNNAGTLAQPWALTSFIQGSTNNNKMAGKRIGIMAGNYTITSAFPEQANDYIYCKLNLPGGTASSPTYVASCNTSGQYSARAATITWGGAAATTNGLMGNGDSAGGYITIDGLRINGNGVSATSQGGGHIVQFYGNVTNPNFRSESSSASSPGIVVKNCELWNINPQPGGSYVGGNYAAVAFIAVIAPVCQNNLIHDVLYTGSDANAAQHETGCLEIGCPNSQYLNNTIYNCPSGIWVKEGSTGTTAAYNYIYNCARTAADIAGLSSAFYGFDGGAGNPNPGPAPITQLIHHNVIEACGTVHKPTIGSPVATSIAVNVYNNTVYDTNTTSTTGWLQSAVGCTNQYYNNIYMTTAGSSGAGGGSQNGKVVLTLGHFSNTDYNCYFSANGGYTDFWGLSNGSNFTSLAAWKTAVQASAAGSESHSINVNPTFSTASPVMGAGAAQFQLQATSPCKGTGQSGVNMGAWDGTTTQIGCSFAPGGSGSPAPAVPDAPSLTVS